MGPPIAQLTPEQQKQLEALQQAEMQRQLQRQQVSYNIFWCPHVQIVLPKQQHPQCHSNRLIDRTPAIRTCTFVHTARSSRTLLASPCNTRPRFSCNGVSQAPPLPWPSALLVPPVAQAALVTRSICMAAILPMSTLPAQLHEGSTVHEPCSIGHVRSHSSQAITLLNQPPVVRTNPTSGRPRPPPAGTPEQRRGRPERGHGGEQEAAGSVRRQPRHRPDQRPHAAGALQRRARALRRRPRDAAPRRQRHDGRLRPLRLRRAAHGGARGRGDEARQGQPRRPRDQRRPAEGLHRAAAGLQDGGEQGVLPCACSLPGSATNNTSAGGSPLQETQKNAYAGPFLLGAASTKTSAFLSLFFSTAPVPALANEFHVSPVELLCCDDKAGVAERVPQLRTCTARLLHAATTPTHTTALCQSISPSKTSFQLSFASWGTVTHPRVHADMHDCCGSVHARADRFMWQRRGRLQLPEPHAAAER